MSFSKQTGFVFAFHVQLSRSPRVVGVKKSTRSHRESQATFDHGEKESVPIAYSSPVSVASFHPTSRARSRLHLHTRALGVTPRRRCPRRIPARGIASIYISVVKERLGACMHARMKIYALCATNNNLLGALRTRYARMRACVYVCFLCMCTYVRALAGAYICRDTRILVDAAGPGSVYPGGDWRTTGTS